MRAITILIIFTFISCATEKKSSGYHALPHEKSVYDTCGRDDRARKLEAAVPKIDIYPKDKKRYSFELLDVSIREALLELSTQSGIPIIFDENVNGTVTLKIQNRSFYQTLDMITSTGPYDFKKENGFYYVATTNIDSPSWRKLAYTDVYKVRFSRADILLQSISPVYKRFATFDNSKSEIRITAPRGILISMFNQLSVNDRSRNQILLNVTINEITMKGREMLGNFLENNSNIGSFNRLVSIPNETLEQLMKGMRYVQANGELDVKASPSMITQEGEPAIFNSLTKDTQIINRIGARFEMLETGLQMKITPHLTDKDEIVLRIENLKLGDLDETKVHEHNLATTIRIKMNQSVLIGGMLMKKNKVVITKVPYLADLPLLGWFFKSKVQDKVLTEVLFLIKPKVFCRA